MQMQSSVIRLSCLLATLVALMCQSRAVADDRADNLLIVSASTYVDSVPLNQYVTAKTAQGYNVMTYSVPSGTSRTAIKTYIQSLWGTADAPDYILLVGDTDGSSSTLTTIPHWTGGGSKGSDTDLPYACMDAGDDWYPDIFIGRWSVRSVSMLQDVVDKSLFVEAGNFSDPDYTKRGAFLANPDTGGLAEPTHDWVIETYFEPRDFTGIKIYSSEGGNTADVRNAVNNGCLWTLYMGHSGSSGWWDPGFGQGDVNALTNTGLYGIVFGWSCNTAHYTYDECFGETWLRAPNKGAAAYISASDYIYWGSYEAWLPSAELEKGFFKAFFEDEIWEVGAAWQAGLYHFLTIYGNWDGDHNHPPQANEDVCRNFFEEFVVLGDPTLLLPWGTGFSLTADPVERQLCLPGADVTTYTITVEANGNFSDVISLDALGVPSGATVDFSVDNIVPPFTSVLTLSDLGDELPGQYDIQIIGVAGEMSRGTDLVLSLSDATPGTVTLISPADGMLDVARMPTLTWQAQPGAITYDLQIATDASFANIVYNTNVTGTSHTTAQMLELASEHFWHARAVNGCGNSDWSQTWSFTTLDQADYFTEEYGSFDLENFSLVFYPDSSGDIYGACGEAASEYPSDPSGGTAISLGDDDYSRIYFSDGQTFTFYDVIYDSCCVGSNGYITFASGDSTYSPSLAGHFNMPRISALFNDLNPSAGGTVSWKEYEDRIAITYDNVPNYGSSNSNNFQVELYYDGEVRITWLGIDAGGMIVGLSEGLGLPDTFIESDLSAVNPCNFEVPPTAYDANLSTPMNATLLIDLVAEDDGLPNPPGMLTYGITVLPIDGVLFDPGAGLIDSVPYALVGGGSQVEYVPDDWYIGQASFAFLADDGGEPPTGGPSNIAVMTIDVTVPDPSVVYSYPLDHDPGWTTEGQWAFGIPTGGGSHYGDPESGFTGNNVYGYNLDGDYTTNMPEYHLTTTAIDCSQLESVELRFQRWLGVERNPYDHAYVQISSDGSNWETLWENPATTISDSSWNTVVLDISELADGRATIYLRWTMGATDGSTTYPGWNLDDIEIRAIVLGPMCPGDLDNDGDVDLSDLSQLLAHYGEVAGINYSDGDIDGDGDVDLSDLSALLAVYGTSCS